MTLSLKALSDLLEVKSSHSRLQGGRNKKKVPNRKREAEGNGVEG